MKKVVYIIAFSIFSNAAYAQPGMDNFVGVFNWLGQFLELMFQNEYAMFGILIIAITAMLYNIFVPLIAKIPIFGGDGKSPANKYGRVVSLCLALLSSIGIFSLIYLNGGITSVREILENVLGPYATFAGIALAMLVFGMIYFGFKDVSADERWKRGLWGVGLAMVFFGGLLARPTWHMLGWFIVFIALLWMLFKGGPASGARGSSGGGSGTGPDAPDDPSKKVKIEGIVLDEAGRPKGDVEIKATDRTGADIPGAVARSAVPSGLFVMEFHVSNEVELRSVKGEKNGVNYDSGWGFMFYRGTKVEGIRLLKNSTANIWNVKVAAKPALTDWEIFGAVCRPISTSEVEVTFRMRRGGP